MSRGSRTAPAVLRIEPLGPLDGGSCFFGSVVSSRSSRLSVSDGGDFSSRSKIRFGSLELSNQGALRWARRSTCPAGWNRAGGSGRVRRTSGTAGIPGRCRTAVLHRYTSSAAGTNSHQFKHLLSDQTDRLAMTPLFQVQASGWPFIAHRRIGLSAFWAAITPSQNVGNQLTVLKQRSSVFGRMRSRLGEVLSVNSRVGQRLTTRPPVTRRPP